MLICHKFCQNMIFGYFRYYYLEKFFQVGAQLPPQEKEELIEFLRRNINVFTWSTYETPRVDPNFICHHLNVNPSVTPKKQPPRRSSRNHSDAVRDEVT